MPGPKAHRKSILTILCIAFVMGVGTFGGFPPPSIVRGTSTDPISLVNETAQALTIAFELPGYTLEPVAVGGQTFVQIQLEGLPFSDEPGAPQLPLATTLIGLPPTGSIPTGSIPTGTPSLQILEIEQTQVALPHPIYPAPAPAPIDTAQPGIDAAPYTFAWDRDLYASDAFAPAQVAEIAPIGQLRRHRIARLTLHPMQYNPAQGTLQVTTRLVIRVNLGGAAVQHNAATPDPVFTPLLQASLINYQTARAWQAPSLPSLAAAAVNLPATQPGSYRITVRHDGIYRLTYPDLQDAGLPVDEIDPRTLRLYEQGEEIAIRVIGEQDGSFDPADQILFYGRVPASRYVDHNLYWLCYGGATGLRIQTRDATPGSQPDGVLWTTARYEENRFYDSHVRAADGDHWYAAKLHLAESPSQEATVNLMPPDTSVPTATARIRLASYTARLEIAPDHHATFAVNGEAAGELWWDGITAVTATLPLDRATLAAGSNIVRVTLPGDTGTLVEGAWLDAVEVRYPLQTTTDDQITLQGQADAKKYTLNGFTADDVLLYDISSPQQPVLLVGAVTSSGTLSFSDTPSSPATYLALTGAQIRRPATIKADMPSNLSHTTHQANYLIVTHPDFAAAVQPLADLRRAQELQVTIVDVEQIYDEFGGGLLSPQAIRDFLSHAYHNWAKPAPTFVLLVGDGSYDFLDHHGYGAATYLPPFLEMVDPWWGETAADNRYVTVDGGDPLPDMLLGRLPVNTPAEAAAVVSKIVQYEQDPWLGDWNARHVFVTDDQDAAGDFAATANSVYNAFIADPWVGTRIYLDDLDAGTAQEKAVQAWQQGALLISFVGHSSWHQWAAESILDIHDVPDLHNDRRWPVVLSMTCFTGFFHHPEYGTLDESLLRLSGGGAIATWSPSGLGVATGHDHLYQGFYRAVFTNGTDQLGPATLYAKMRLYSQAPAHADLLDTYHLFGDPAMALNLTIRPWPYALYLPLVHKN